jgi:hypothetical protein
VKKKNILFILVLFFIMSPVVALADASSVSVAECMAYGQSNRKLTGDSHYYYCYRATCNGTYQLANMILSSRYSCSNGNPQPYTKWAMDGCSIYSGSCSTNDARYCERDLEVNCDLKSDGSPYVASTTTTAGSATTTTNRVTAGTTTNQATTKKTTGSGTTRVIIARTTTQAATESTRAVVSTDTTTTTASKSSNTGIESLTINGTNIGYSNDKSEYTIKLPYGLSYVDVQLTLSDDKATYNINGASNISDDESNQIVIDVTAEDGSTKEVIINVHRYSGESNDCTLANIYMEDYDLNFDANTYEYKLRVKNNTKTLDLEVVPTDALHAKYEVADNNALQNNSVVTINVKAEDGTLCVYKITVKKTGNLWLIILIIIIIVAALAGGGYAAFRYIKRSKNRYKYE